MSNQPHPSISRSVFAGVLGAVALATVVVAGAVIAGAGSSSDSANDAPEAAIAEPAPADATTTTTAPALPEGVPATTVYYEDSYWADYEKCMQETGVYDYPMEAPEAGVTTTTVDFEAIDAAYEAADAKCAVHLPEEIRIENAAWQAHSECVEDALGEGFWEFEEDWDEERYQEADLECRSVLPEEIQQELAAYDAHNDCVDEFMGPQALGGTSVSVYSLETYADYIFGDEDASVVISQVDGEITVTVDGDVVVHDEAYFEAQEAIWVEADAACGHLLPEDAYG